MEIRLEFQITFINEEKTTQEIKAQADPQHSVEKQTLMLMQQMFTQYTQVGILRETEKGTFKLVCPSQIATIECTPPSILLAHNTDMPTTLITQ
jgi:hypothetical protein